MRGGFVRGGVMLWAVVVLAPTAGRAGDVNVDVNIGSPPPVVVAQPPWLQPVPQTPVYYAPSVPYNIFYYDGRYYSYHDDDWYWTASVRGPWMAVAVGRVPRPVLAVPVAYYRVPPGHLKKYHRRPGPPPWAGHGRKHHRGHHHHDD
jgi:hypothetical protein